MTTTCLVPDDHLGTAQQSIYPDDNNASLDVTQHPQIFTVVGPPFGGPPTTGTLCTAWLAASNVVVTNAHCADGTPGNPAIPYPLMRLDGTYTVNLAFNASDAVTGTPGFTPTGSINSIPGSSPNTGLLTHPDYTVVGHEHAASDVAILYLPPGQEVPRCAMTPLRVVADIPSPAVLQADEGTFFAWLGMHVEVYGAGFDTAGCTGTMATPVARFAQTISAAFPIHGWRLHVPGGDQGQNAINHICFGDSGGPILTGNQVVFGTNIAPGQVVGMASTSVTEVGAPPEDAAFFAPLLSASIRPWLVENALDLDEDGIEAWEDNCDRHSNDQTNSDGDCTGGDVCDPCPHDASDASVDTDGDAVPDCADPCPNSALLDCPGPGIDEYGDADHDGLCNDDDDCGWARRTPSTTRRC